ncbi:TniQ family protein [Roseateles cellulosilyticus]|uniref:TniQ family protein n=1 Tax=Pelomonas cellulosilytica TaxID=2906762 RepID=A0ABS8XQY7_9BURK|nr:TniQ family protein [Pelomonas sp. P8]MCE4554243.1 TniQ family protein [Pelomonas sp. P8]
MNLSFPEPQPDELLDGWLGRCSVMHSCTSIANLIAGLRMVTGLPVPATVLDVIAASLGLTPQEVLFRHTTLPAQRAFSARAVGIEKQSTEKLSSSGVTRRSDVEALACPHCAQEDAARGGLSYWRRMHHLPGVDWCPVHQEALVRFTPTAFEKRPSDVLAQTAGERCAVPAAIDGSSALGRYAELMVRWLQRSSVYSCTALNRVVYEGCRAMGLRCSQVGKRLLVSDLVKQRLPTEWLALYWPDVLSKAPAAYLPRLDGPSRDKHVGYPGATCALVLAALFESVDDIQRQLEVADAQVRADHARHTDTALFAARQDFVRGSSLAAACNAHGVAVEQLERWLRDAAKLWTSTTDPLPKAMATQPGASLQAA